MLSKSVPGFVIGVLVTMVVAFIVATAVRPSSTAECPPPPGSEVPVTDATEIFQENRDLRARVAALEARLSSQWPDAGSRSAGMGPPPNLDPVLTPKGFRAAMTRTFKDAGPNEPHLLGIDCDEYPCIAWVGGPNAEEAGLKAVLSSPHFSPLDQMTLTTSTHFAFGNSSSEPRRMAIALYPTESGERAAFIKARLDARFDKFK